jgi:CcmD family protein
MVIDGFRLEEKIHEGSMATIRLGRARTRKRDVIQPPVDFLARKGNNSRVSLVFLAAVNVIIWTGLFVYLWRLDRRISARERER